MDKKYIIQLITSYADGEIGEQKRKDEAEKLIDKNPDINFDYRVQILIKSIISERFKIQPAPEYLVQSIKRKIKTSG